MGPWAWGVWPGTGRVCRQPWGEGDWGLGGEPARGAGWGSETSVGRGEVVAGGRERLGSAPTQVCWTLTADKPLLTQTVALPRPFLLDPRTGVSSPPPQLPAPSLLGRLESPAATTGSHTLLPFPFSFPVLPSQPSREWATIQPPSIGPYVHRSNPWVPDHMTVSHSSCNRAGGRSGTEASSSSPEQEPLRNPSSLGAAMAGGGAWRARAPGLVWLGSCRWPLVVVAGSRRGLRGRPSPEREPTLVTLV